MSEHHERGAVFCAQNLLPKVQAVGLEALQTERDRYSSGFPDFIGGSERKLGYNSEWHNFVMGRDAARLLGHLGFSTYDQLLGQTTGWSHDRDQMGGRGIDERNSATWLETQLQNAGVAAHLARRAGKAVLGTEPLFSSEGYVIGQKVSQMEFDSPEDELWVKAVDSADFSQLYTPIGRVLANYLYIQRCELDATETPPMDDLTVFLGNQVRMLDEFTYALPVAEKVFATHRPQVCAYAEFVYDQACRNGIDSWGRLTNWSMQFMDNPDIDLARLN